MNGFPFCRKSCWKAWASPWTAGAIAPESIVTGAEMTLAKPAGSAERYGLVSIFVAASATVVMMKMYVWPAVSGGNVTLVWAVPKVPALASATLFGIDISV